MENLTCKDCKESFRRKPQSGPKPLRCPDCASEHKKKKQRDYNRKRRQRPQVREQDREYARSWAERNPERRKELLRRAYLARTYKISPEDYETMFQAQRGRCAICGRTSEEVALVSKRSDLVVDHDHEHDLIRELLCHPCNVALGFFEEDTDRLLAAAEYVKTWKGLKAYYLSRQGEEGQD